MLSTGVAGCGEVRIPVEKERSPLPSVGSARSTSRVAAESGEPLGEQPARRVELDEGRWASGAALEGRDPFLSALPRLAGEGAEEPLPGARRKTELELGDLSDFRVTALVTSTPVPSAMLTGPDGVGHVVRPGSPVGRRGGRVARITADAVVVGHVDEDTGSRIETKLRLHPAR